MTKKNKFMLRIIGILFILAFFTGAATTQDQPPGLSQPQTEEIAQEEVAEETQAVTEEETAPGNVTMDFKDADITNVLRILSYKSGINIVAGPEVKGLVTIRLSNVPWEKALEVVLRTYGFSYERVGNIIRVTTTENLKQEELTTEVYSLSYGKAEDVTEAIDNMLTERGKVKFDERTNTLVVTDIPTNLYKISQIVKKLDRRTPQVMIEARIIETTLADSEKLGIDWSLKVSALGAKKPITFPFTRRVSSDIEREFEDFFAYGQSTAPTGGSQYAGTTQSQFPTITHSSRGLTEVLSAFPFAGTNDFSFGTLDFTTFKAVLEYLKTRNDTEILSNPRIATLNNQASNILIGQIIGIPTYERNSETGQMEITGYQEKQVGVMLNVTPHVNVEGDISVDLKPEISDLLRYDTLDASRGIVAPVFSTRTAETQVMIRDGETLMIGGLIKKTVKDKLNKVPLLGDIPLVGKTLFSKTEKAVDRTELIIFLTVHLVREEWVPPAGSASTLVSMPKVKDIEVKRAIPGQENAQEEKKKRDWWQLW